MSTEHTSVAFAADEFVGAASGVDAGSALNASPVVAAAAAAANGARAIVPHSQGLPQDSLGAWSLENTQTWLQRINAHLGVNVLSRVYAGKTIVELVALTIDDHKNNLGAHLLAPDIDYFIYMVACAVNASRGQPNDLVFTRSCAGGIIVSDKVFHTAEVSPSAMRECISDTACDHNARTRAEIWDAEFTIEEDEVMILFKNTFFRTFRNTEAYLGFLASAVRGDLEALAGFAHEAGEWDRSTNGEGMFALWASLMYSLGVDHKKVAGICLSSSLPGDDFLAGVINLFKTPQSERGDKWRLRSLHLRDVLPSHARAAKYAAAPAADKHDAPTHASKVRTLAVMEALRDLMMSPDCVLEELEYWGNSISSEEAIVLGHGISRCQSLRTLGISDMAPAVSSIMCMAIAHCPSLHCLHYNFNAARPNAGKAILQLAEAIQACPTLRRLSLMGLSGSESAIEQLGSIFCGNIAEVDLALATVGSTGALYVASAAASHKQLSVLDLRCCELGNAGASFIAEGLINHEGLVALTVSMNQIGNNGAADLARVISSAPNLRSVDMSGNRIQNSGGEAIGAALPLAKALESLDLTGNQIHNRGAVVIAEAISGRKSSLKTLQLSYNWFGLVGTRALANALHNNTTIRLLGVTASASFPIVPSSAQVEEEDPVEELGRQIEALPLVQGMGEAFSDMYEAEGGYLAAEQAAPAGGSGVAATGAASASDASSSEALDAVDMSWARSIQVSLSTKSEILAPVRSEWETFQDLLVALSEEHDSEQRRHILMGIWDCANALVAHIPQLAGRVPARPAMGVGEASKPGLSGSSSEANEEDVDAIAHNPWTLAVSTRPRTPPPLKNVNPEDRERYSIAQIQYEEQRIRSATARNMTLPLLLEGFGAVVSDSNVLDHEVLKIVFEYMDETRAADFVSSSSSAAKFIAALESLRRLYGDDEPELPTELAPQVAPEVAPGTAAASAVQSTPGLVHAPVPAAPTTPFSASSFGSYEPTGSFASTERFAMEPLQLSQLAQNSAFPWTAAAPQGPDPAAAAPAAAPLPGPAFDPNIFNVSFDHSELSFAATDDSSFNNSGSNVFDGSFGTFGGDAEGTQFGAGGNSSSSSVGGDINSDNHGDHANV